MARTNEATIRAVNTWFTVQLQITKYTSISYKIEHPQIQIYGIADTCINYDAPDQPNVHVAAARSG